MTTTAMGLFDGFAEAQRLIQPLVAQGIRCEDITLIANREATSVGEVLAAAAWGVHVDVGPASRGEPAALIALGVPADEVEPYAMVLDGGGDPSKCRGGRAPGGRGSGAAGAVCGRGSRGTVRAR
jgi:hypothetical protein